MDAIFAFIIAWAIVILMVGFIGYKVWKFFNTFTLKEKTYEENEN